MSEWLLQLVDWIRGAGPLGVGVYALAYVAATLFLLPGSILTLCAGFAYGPLRGTLLVSPVSVLAATLAFLLGRGILRGWISRRIEAYPRFKAIDKAIGESGFKIVLLLRLSPVFPFNLLNYALGLTRVLRKELRPLGIRVSAILPGSVNTRMGVERCVRFAFELAKARDRKHVTLVHKTNVLTYAGDLWQRVFDEVAADHGDVETAYHHVDAACIYFVQDPGRYDVVVTDNLFGDILTDLGGAVSGGIGFAASGNLNPARTGPSMFEPVHGSAPDIAGQGVANPIAMIASFAMCLRYSFNMVDAADRLEAAIASVLDDGLRTKDIMSAGMTEIGTTQMGDAIAARFKAEL